MEAARVLKLRGHNPTIYEKSDKLGGIFIAAAAPDFKSHDKQLIEWFKLQIKDLQIKELGIPVQYNTEVKDIQSLGADEVIIATGAKANHLPIPGNEKIMGACDYLLNVKETGENVVIIGGGLTGCEMALDLYNKGKKPVIVEMKDDLMAVPNLCLANSSYLRDFFKANHVPVYLNAATKEVGDGYVLIQDSQMKETRIPADTVIESVGYKPTPLAPKGRHVHLVGDCNKVGNLRTVIWRAWDVAMKI